MAKKILITGASGLVGTRLTELLMQKGYQVSHLSRSSRSGEVQSFTWDVKKGHVDSAAFDGVSAIVHLAGAGIADARWTPARKKEIIDSRVKSTALLFQNLKKNGHTIKAFVSASAIGYYGTTTDDQKIFLESSVPGDDFLAGVVKQWEAEVDTISALNIRVVKIRTGVVLSEKGGALKEMAKPIRLGVGSPLGTGKQQMSWIHIDDLCEIYIKAIEDETMTGAYNAVTSQSVSNAEMTRAIARALNKPLWLPNVPAFVLRIILGEMADLVLKGSRISNEKILKTGFVIKFPELSQALKNLFNAG